MTSKLELELELKMRFASLFFFCNFVLQLHLKCLNNNIKKEYIYG